MQIALVVIVLMLLLTIASPLMLRCRMVQQHVSLRKIVGKTLLAGSSRPSSSLSSSSSSSSSSLSSSSTENIDKGEVRRLRLQTVGLRKAVDPGPSSLTPRPRNTYNPRPFRPLSGAPEKSTFNVLGIETSCDDTAAAVVRSDGVILGECVASQKLKHARHGGVVPSIAMEEHKANIDEVVSEAIEMAARAEHGAAAVENHKWHDVVDAVAVTVGPGLEICLRIGFNKAVSMMNENELTRNMPFVALHHLEEHILMATLPPANAKFPFLSLLVSGGHCQILKCYSQSKYEVIGGTIDDSLGECYDKVARMLGVDLADASTTLGSDCGSGGEAIEFLASKIDSENANPKQIRQKYPLSVPMRNRKDCEFSFAGLKNSFRMLNARVREEHNLGNETDVSLANSNLMDTRLPDDVRCQMAWMFQDVAIKHLEDRVGRAIKLCATSEEIFDSLVIAGGVAANMEVRTRLKNLAEGFGWRVVVPDVRLCTDNGVMAAWAGVKRLEAGSSDDFSQSEIHARFPFAAIEDIVD